MLRTAGTGNQKMLRLTDQENGRCARWCALVVLVAVCSLAIHVATRYGSVQAAASQASVAVQKSNSFSSHEPGRQRLTKDAANWLPPVLAWVNSHQPAREPRTVAVDPAIPNLTFDSSLYYRPPPTFLS